MPPNTAVARISAEEFSLPAENHLLETLLKEGKGTQPSLYHDRLFFGLAKFMVEENFYKRSIRGDFQEGEERSSSHPAPLHAITVVRDASVSVEGKLRDIAIKASSEVSYRRMSIGEFLEYVRRNPFQDGVYLMRSTPDEGIMDVSSRPHFLLAISDKAQRSVRSVQSATNGTRFDDLLSRYLPSNYAPVDGGGRFCVGMRTRTALAAGLAGNGGRVYTISQTVHDGSRIGKLSIFGKHGLESEFCLQAMARSEYCRDEDLFHPAERITGLLRTYSARDKNRPEVDIITPSHLGISPKRRDSYLNGQKL